MQRPWHVWLHICVCFLNKYAALQNQSSTQEAAEQTHIVYTGKHSRIFNVFTLYYFKLSIYRKYIDSVAAGKYI